MRSNLLLYCQKSWLDILIAERYYFDMHYCWVTTEFDRKGNPTSSNPRKRYEILKSDVESSDLHSSMIKQNKAGIKVGATKLMDKGIISTDACQEIFDCVKMATINQFKPLILIMPFELVKAMLIPVKPKNKANPLSEEYIIEQLGRDKFDLIEY